MEYMEYDEWINRERRIRIKILMSSPQIRETKTYRVCQDCGEIGLCHEKACPNCRSSSIVTQRLDDVQAEVLSGKRIRCRSRFDHLT